VIKTCRDAGLAEPEFGNYSGGFRIVFASKGPIEDLPGPESGQIEGEVASEVAGEVTGEVAGMLKVLFEKPLTRTEIQAALGLKGQANFRVRYLEPGLKTHLVEMTIPEKPNSRLQKYRLTEKGRALLADGE
jgi:ATP-dependent DNA helicase RecG